MRNEKGLNLKAATVSTKKTRDKALMQVERGRNLPQLADIDVLLSTYDHSEQIPHFRDVIGAASGRKGLRDWWEGRLPPGFVPESAKLLYSGEASAIELSIYQTQFVPDFLRTPAYAEVMAHADHPGADDAEIRLWVELSQGRQEVLNRDDPPRVRCVVDEAVLHRQVGGPDVLREQIDYLVELGHRPNIDIRVLPFAGGASADTGSFTRLVLIPELPNYPGLAHVKATTHDIYLEEPEEIAPFDEVFELLSAQALRPEESRDLLTTTSDRIGARPH
ncbi:DUF5753 domain-containing protein [Prauserella marina]|nr:DUF5753 domain-containing protein [Prauserella marina]